MRLASGTMSRRTTIIALSVVVVAILAFTLWSLDSHYGTEEVTLSNGRLVSDLSVAEAGTFAGSEFASSRRRYLEWLDAHERFEASSVPVDAPHQIRTVVAPLVHAALERDASLPDAIELPDAAADKLGLVVTRLVSSLAGVAPEHYLSLLPHGVEAGSPTYPGLVESFENDFGVDASVPPDASSDQWRDSFLSIYRTRLTYDDGRLLVRGILADPLTFYCAVDVHAHARLKSLLEERYGEKVHRRLTAVLGMEMPIFFQGVRHDEHTHEPDESRPRGSVPLDATVAFVVETAGGDRYPVIAYLEYNPERQEWVLVHIYRHVSIRQAVAPTPVF